MLGQLDRELPASSRTTAADVLSRARLSVTQLSTLADSLKSAGPLEVDHMLDAFEQTTDEAIGLKLVKVLGESSALSSLRADAIKQHLAKYGPAVQTAAGGLYLKLNADAAKQKARVDQLLTRISTGDVRRGQVVFQSEKAACYTCHAIGYRGGNVGPDLTKVGQVRTERDLLEAIVYPSTASFEASSRSSWPRQTARSSMACFATRLRRRSSWSPGRTRKFASPGRYRGGSPQHRLGDARRARPATEPSRAGRPGCLSQGLPVTPGSLEKYRALSLRRNAKDSAISSMPFMPSSMLIQPCVADARPGCGRCVS